MAEKGRQGKDGRIKRQRKAKETGGQPARYDCPSLDLVLNPCAAPPHTHPPTGSGSLLPEHSTLTLGSFYCQSICHLPPTPPLKISEPRFACPVLSPTNSKKLSYCSTPYSAPSLLNS